MIIAIAVEYDGPLSELLFEAVGVKFGLTLPDTRVSASALGLDETERLAVVTPEHIVDEALARPVWHSGDGEFRVPARLIERPSRFVQQKVDEGVARRSFVVVMRVRDRLVGLLGGRNLGPQRRNLRLEHGA